MRVVPGTHRLPMIEHDDKPSPDNMIKRGQGISDRFDNETGVAMPLAAGELSLHHTALVHCSPGNDNDDRRMGLGHQFHPDSCAGRSDRSSRAPCWCAAPIAMVTTFRRSGSARRCRPEAQAAHAEAVRLFRLRQDQGFKACGGVGVRMRRWAAILLILLLPALAAAQPTEYRQTAAVLSTLSADHRHAARQPRFPRARTVVHQPRCHAGVPRRAGARFGPREAQQPRQSTQGRDIPVVYLSAEGLDDPAAIRRLGRPVIWFIAQQHGNEPAGGEAMLALASALAKGELAPLLDKISVAIVPRANVDGAAADKRVLASGADSNRDHLLLSQPEVRALHLAMRALPPDVVFDHHEFSVAWRWVEKFNGLQAADVMILEATNPSIPGALSDIARNLYRPALEAAIRRQGLSSFDYVTTDPTPDRARVARRHRARHRAQHLRPAWRGLLPDRDARRRHRPAELPAARLDAFPAGQGGAQGERRRT
jgi:hypothetical protein